MSWDINPEHISDLLIESLLIILILFSPFIYGSVTILPFSLAESLSFVLLLVFFLKIILEEKISLIKIPALFLILFLILIVFQLLSLSENLLSFLSPVTSQLYKDFRINPNDNLRLSIYLESTINMLLQFLSFLAVFFVCLNYVDTERKARRIILTIIIAGFAYSFYGILCGFGMSHVEFSTFTNRNHFSAYVQMIIPLVIGYSLIKVSKSSRFILIFMASVMILALFLSLSRAGRICFSLSLLTFFFLLRIKRPIRETVTVIVILSSFLSMFIGVIGLGPIMQRMETLLHPFREYAGRLDVLKDSFRIIKDFPIFGTGLGTFTEIAQKYKTTDWQVTYGFSHNEPIQLLVETGALGFFFISLFLFKYLKNIFSLWLKRNLSFAVYITLGCFVGVFSIILHSFFDFVFHVPANAILFFIILALAYRVVYLKVPQEQLPIPKHKILLPKSLRISLIVILCLLFLFGESLVLKRYQAEAIFEKVKETKIPETDIEAMLEYKKVLEDIDRAIILNPLNSRYLNKKADLLSEMALREDLKDILHSLGEEFRNQKEVLELAQRFYERAVNLNPTKADYHLRLGWLYSVLDEQQLMQQEFKKALMLDPQNTKIKSYLEQY